MKKILLGLVLVAGLFSTVFAGDNTVGRDSYYKSDLSTTVVTVYTGGCYFEGITVVNSSTMTATVDVSSNSAVVFTVYAAASSMVVVPVGDIMPKYCGTSLKVADRETVAATRVTGCVDVIVGYSKESKY